MADITPIASLNGELAMPEKVWMQGPPGPQGQQGEPGAAATVTVGTVTTGEPGTDAIVTNSGTENDAVFNFTIPKGDTGATGPAGADGVSPTVSASKSGNVTTITIVDAAGTKTATINDGEKGDTGPAGPAGAGVPDGGTSGQLLSKTESGTAWIDPPQSGVQPDWNQNDSTAADYVKNRPFYTGGPVETVFVEERTVSFADMGGMYMAEFPSTFEATVGETYKVSWDGTIYECACVEYMGIPSFGNLSIAGVGSDTGEPFFVAPNYESKLVIYTADTSASHILSISGLSSEVVKIDEKYLPDTISTKSEVEVAQSTADTAQNTANEAQITANTAKSTAEAAQSTANTAKTTADAAQTTANAALPKSGGEMSGVIKSSSSIEFPCNYTSNSFATGLTICSVLASKVLTNYFRSPDIGPSIHSHIETVVTNLGGIVIYNPNKVSNKKTVTIAADGERLDFSGIVGRKPITISAKDIILSSSTANSTKQFRITVDDSGTISATEVTS